MSHLDAREPSASHDLVCLSHLRWDFVFQRPQHLLTRSARDGRVFFFEEPVHTDGPARLDVTPREGNVFVAVPQLPGGLTEEERTLAQKRMLDELLAGHAVDRYVLWFYTPMAMGFAAHLRPLATVYDCMDELSHFQGAPPELRERERELMRRAELVFTGGQSLYEAKRDLHPSVHAFPSSIDFAHFSQGREVTVDPDDQAPIERPRIGYFGVIDERLDIALLAAAADLRPDWHFVMIGPVVKIDPETLPKRANIHWLGGKSYKELPRYIAGWDLAMMPFARNDATKFISPTKTPEYLAAGRPVVSTSIRDVVRPYGALGLVAIADTAEEFVAAAERELGRTDRAAWLAEVDAFLAGNSWDATWDRMRALIHAAIRGPRAEAKSASRVEESNAATLG